MSPAAPPTVDDYLSSLPAERRADVAAVRDLMRRNLPPGFEEGMLFGMISWFIPPERYGRSYNGQPLTIASLAAQKSHLALYLTGLYAEPALAEWFAAAYQAAGKKLDMGKSCVRFSRREDLPLAVIAQAAAKISVDEYVALYEQAQAGRKQKPIAMPGREPANPAKPAPATRRKPRAVATSAASAKRAAAKKTRD